MKDHQQASKRLLLFGHEMSTPTNSFDVRIAHWVDGDGMHVASDWGMHVVASLGIACGMQI
jgi:hypothetical protein